MSPAQLMRKDELITAKSRLIINFDSDLLMCIAVNSVNIRVLSLYISANTETCITSS